nr:disulfide bond formation protein B [Wolbachia endosymbiont of Atemnus politus]
MLNNSRIPAIFLLSSAVALIFAYVLEYFYNMPPCKLCTYERIVYYITGLLAVAYILKNNKISLCDVLQLSHRCNNIFLSCRS